MRCVCGAVPLCNDVMQQMAYKMGQAKDKRQHATGTVRHASCNVTMCRMGTGDGQETGDVRHAPCNSRRAGWEQATEERQHATGDVGRDDAQRPTCNVTSVRYATKHVRQTRSNGQQCRKRQPSRDHWQMRNRQQTTCNMQQTTCNGRHEFKHATDNIRTTCSGRYTANNRRHATRNRQHAPTPQATCSREHRHATQHATCSMQQAACNR